MSIVMWTPVNLPIVENAKKILSGLTPIQVPLKPILASVLLAAVTQRRNANKYYIKKSA